MIKIGSASQETKLLPMCVGLRIIGACNLDCPFCYGPRHTLPPINTEKLLRVIENFPKLGVRKVVVTGGEPLLAPDLETVLRELKNLGLNILLNTNGVTLKHRFDNICSTLDWLALPLDADDEEIHRLMRPGPLLEYPALCQLVTDIKSRYPRLKIRIGTVVCALNYKNILGIPELISGNYRPDVWRLYEFTPASYGFLNRESLEISHDLFEDVVSLALERSRQFDVPTDVYRVSTRDGRYLFVEPNGDAMMIINGEEVIIGNWFDDLSTIIDRCNELLDYEVVRQRSLASF